VTRSTKAIYLIPILSKSLDVLELLEQHKAPLTLEEIHQRTRISKTTVFRILRTLVHRGYVSRPEDGRYRLVSRPRKMRFGFGGQSGALPFSNAVTGSLRAAAMATGIELIVLDNQYNGEIARQNAEEFIKQRVDLVIEFQTDRYFAPIIADRLAAGGIPLIAVDIPHPNAVFFGVDNYRAGLEAGELLGAYAQKFWGGQVDLVVGLDLAKAGTLVQSRITGAFEGIRSRISNLQDGQLIRVDGTGLEEESHKAMHAVLTKYRKAKHILVAPSNDTSALGALHAARELRRDHHLAILSHDCIPAAMEEMKRKNSPLIGSISHEVATYGPRLVQLGLALLNGESVPPYNYVEHRLVSRFSQLVADRAARSS
jgi:ribose transport system substrate-binding protein